MQATVIWNQKMGFSGETESGHHLAMDAAPENGGDNQAPRPTELLLHPSPVVPASTLSRF